MHVGNYLTLVQSSEQQLADAFDAIAEHHRDEPDVETTCHILAGWSHQHVAALAPLQDRYAEGKGEEPERLTQALFQGTREGSLALLRDLHDLWLLANEVSLCWALLSQAAKALRDSELMGACDTLGAQTKRQLAWLMTRMQQAAPQTLIVAA